MPIVPVAFNWQGGGTQTTLGYDPESEAAHTLSANTTQAVATTLRANSGRNQVESTYLPQGMAVRRLTPVECARLQGFPDDWLDITFRGKPAADGPKYRALGNSIAVPVMRWIGSRIAMVDALSRTFAEAAE